MIVKALLAAMGLRALPQIHNEAVHDAANVKASLLAGHARIVRLSAAADMAAAAGQGAIVEAVHERQSEVRDALDDLTRRLEK